MRHNHTDWVRHESGSSLVETAMVVPVLLLLLIGAVDFGRGYYSAIEVSSAAESGALYGVQFPSDTAGMVAAAKLDANELPSLQSAVTYGCECSDGTGVSANCGTEPTCNFNVVNYVEVDATATYVPILRYPGFPSPWVLKGTARMRSSHY
jgi:Flp pilus assembly protein TadG